MREIDGETHWLIELFSAPTKSWRGEELTCYGLRITDRKGTLVKNYRALCTDKSLLETLLLRLEKETISLSGLEDVMEDFIQSLYME